MTANPRHVRFPLEADAFARVTSASCHYRKSPVLLDHLVGAIDEYAVKPFLGGRAPRAARRCG